MAEVKYCRCCAERCENYIQLEGVSSTEAGNIKYAEVEIMLRMFRDIEPNTIDALPNNICLICLGQIKSSYAFYLKMLEVKNILQELLKPRKTVGSKLPLLMPKNSTNCSKTRSKIVSAPKRRYPCQECSKIFTTSRQLNAHHKLHENMNVCRFCGYFFLKKPNLDDHIKSAHPASRFECQICKKILISRNLLFKHLKTQHGIYQRTYHCTECKDLLPNRFENSFQLQEHIKAVHPTFLSNSDTDKLKVTTLHKFETEMNEEFLEDMDEEFLDEFLLIHNQNSFCWDDLSLPPFDYEFGSLLSDTDAIAVNPNNRFKCPRCIETFPTQQMMNQHLAHYHDEFVLICNVCGLAFNRIAELKKHRKSHSLYNTVTCSKQITIKKPVESPSTTTQCSLCDKTFKTLPGLKYHLKIHAGVKHFTCPYCQKKFTANINLNAHIRIVHAEIKPHICSLCDRRFASLDHLKKHVMSVHQKERNHLCSTCGKSFSQFSHLTQHTIIHTGLKPFPCYSCSSGFVKKIELKRHLEKMHRDDGGLIRINEDTA